MSRETQPPQRNARGAKNTFGLFALRFALALAPALILAACGSAPKRAAVERNTGAIAPKPTAAATAPRRRQIATSRRKMSPMNGVVLMSTPKRSGHTCFGSAITYSKIDAFRSHRAAFRPAEYSPSACSISSM